LDTIAIAIAALLVSMAISTFCGGVAYGSLLKFMADSTDVLIVEKVRNARRWIALTYGMTMVVAVFGMLLTALQNVDGSTLSTIFYEDMLSILERLHFVFSLCWVLIVSMVWIIILAAVGSFKDNLRSL
jgi:hypothetical protein